MRCWAFLGLPQLLGVSIGAEKTEGEGARALGNLGSSLLYLPSATYRMHGHVVQGLLLNWSGPSPGSRYWVPGTNLCLCVDSKCLR